MDKRTTLDGLESEDDAEPSHGFLAATGSGSVDTSKAPNLKQALEAQGITINQTLWDLYMNLRSYRL